MMKTKGFFLYFFSILWGAINLLPLLIVLFGSFKTTAEIYMGPFSVPATFKYDNYVKALIKANVLKGIGNSFFLAIGSVILMLGITAMASYVLARYKGKIINMLYLYFILGILVPVQATFIPLVKMVATFKMQNSYITMFVIYITVNLSISILIITGYMKGISKELDEAAIIDGCGKFRVFTHIIMPLSLPAISTAGILAFISIYNDLIFAILFISKKEMMTITQVIKGFSAEYNIDLGAVFAAVIVAIVPMILIYMAFQEKIISGLAAGSVKG